VPHFQTLQFAADPSYTVSIIHIHMLQLTIQEPAATGPWSAYISLVTSS